MKTLDLLCWQSRGVSLKPLLEDLGVTAVSLDGSQTLVELVQQILVALFHDDAKVFFGEIGIRHGLQVLVPDDAERTIVHEVIYNELCLGVINESSRVAYRDIIRRLVAQGAEGIILGCTEIGMLVSPADSPVPVFDTTAIHASGAVEYCLS